MIAAALFALMLASPTVTASIQDSNWSGYVQYPATPTDSWQQVSGEFQIPLLDCLGAPNGAAIATWVGIGGADGVPQLFQAGVNSWCANGEQIDDVWWTDELHNYAPQYFTSPQTFLSTTLGVNDWITVKLANTTTTTISRAESKIVRHVRHLWRWRIVDGRRVYEKVAVVQRHRVHFNVSTTVTTPGWSATVEDVTSGVSWQGSDASWVEPANPSAEWIVEDPGEAGVPFSCDQGTNCVVVPSFGSVFFSSGSDASASGAPGQPPVLNDEFGTLQTPQQNEYFCPTPIVANDSFVVDYQTSPCSQ